MIDAIEKGDVLEDLAALKDTYSKDHWNLVNAPYRPEGQFRRQQELARLRGYIDAINMIESRVKLMEGKEAH